MKKDSERTEARVSLLTVRLRWVVAAFIVYALEVGVYACFLIRHEVSKGKPPMETTQSIISYMGDFMGVALGSVVFIFGGIDIMMILRDYFRAQREKRVEQARAEARTKGKAEGRAEGKAEGRVEGRAEGTAETYRQWNAWNTRRLDAAANGQPFHEPPPPPPQ